MTLCLYGMESWWRMRNQQNDADSIPVKWEGTWVGCDNKDATQVEAPKRGAFDELVASDMHFHVSGTATTEKEGHGVVVKLTEGPGWDMGEGEEKKKHSDKTHNVYMESLKWSGTVGDQTANLIFSEGENEFGKFVGVGWMRPGNRLTVARRYLSDDDERDLDMVHNVVWEEVCGEEKTRIPPWQCSVMNSDYNPKKRTREEDESEEEEEGEAEKKTKEA